ncbi:MAG: 2-oxoacid:ferredoxin oxidoreductase subunit beta [Desulfobacterales bacterium]|nr:2-oxoacid:ferredoxin oxidoreductase subunit beta [Desulfobacterales bacterium]
MDILKNSYLDEELEAVKKQGFLDYRTSQLPTWCPGCGYFGITHAIVQTCNDLQLKKEEVCVVSGIGCAGRYPIFMDVYGFHTVHGRSLPIAAGIKLSREELTVFAVAGDGDALGIGGGHLPHTIRRNVDITLFLFDNSIYGLTKGQTSPTTPLNQATNSHLKGNPDTPLKPVSLALAYGASFVARCYAGDVDGMKDVFRQAITHKGFSFIHIVTPCVTFDKTNITWGRLNGTVEPIEPVHDQTSFESALRLAEIPRLITGIFYQDKKRPSYMEIIRETQS